MASKRRLPQVAFDGRWCGSHGIGRFATELSNRIEFEGAINASWSPTSPLDCILLSVCLLFNRRRLVYSPGYNVPIFGLCRYVMTVHDLNHMDFPGSSFPKKLYYRYILRRACRRVPLVLTVSEYSRVRISEWAGIPECRIINVGNGVGRAFNVAVKAHQPGYDYFLMVSNRKPHKNEHRMLRAFARVDAASSVKLLITGEPDTRLLNLIGQLGLASRVEFLGQCSDRSLAEYYRGAMGLLFVSLYEGFGLPVVEAMACGTPVITSNACSLPEVAGEAALIVDPLDISAISDAIEHLAVDHGGVRRHLSERGIERSKAFCWDAVAERAHKALSSISVS